jgi:AcrR family transcriptional regulator
LRDSIVNPSEPGPRRRPYRSPKRAAAALKTRRAIRDAAETLFLRDGYARTSMKAIAAKAGVSEKTMYLAFASKATLLRSVIHVAVRGDEAPATLSQRPAWRAVMQGPLEKVFERFAADNAALLARAAPIIALAESAAAAEPELAEYRDRAHAVSRADLHALAAVLKDRGALAADVTVQDAAETMYALVTDERIYLRLTRECGWSDERYADLLARTLEATIGAKRSQEPRQPWV